MVTQYVRFQRQSLIHQKVLSDNVYYRNINTSAGNFRLHHRRRRGSGMQGSVPGLPLSCSHRRRSVGRRARPRVEDWLRRSFGVNVDFECDDALAKLDRLGLLRREGGRLSVAPLDEALVRLDRKWDDYFPIANPAR